MTSFFMQKALKLAERGLGHVHPNPAVGCVIVNDGRIIGEGWHRKFGEAHAEVDAIRSVRPEDLVLLRGSEMYVTLEPCAHHGKTPPCCDAIITAGVARVVYSLDDPNPLVSGRGRAALREKGIETECGDGADEARALNAPFIKFQTTGLPFIAWKAAMTLDGRTALKPGSRSEITGAASRDWTDALRSRADAVMVGAATAIADDPGLRVRNGRGRDPLRILLDTRLRCPTTLKLFTNNADGKTIVVTAEETPLDQISALEARCRVVTAAARDGRLDLDDVVRRLARLGIIEILLESGGGLGRAMLAANLVDRLYFLHAPRFAEFPSLRREVAIVSSSMIGGDSLITAELS